MLDMISLVDYNKNIPITQVSLPLALEDSIARGVLWQVALGRFLLEVPDVARYLVSSGSTIAVDPAINVPFGRVEQFMGMLPLAAFAYQRGMLAFHAAAVTNGFGAVLIAGDSGSGKSTLLTALLQRGWTMLADDLAVVGLDEQGQPVVYPSGSGIALWPMAMKKLGIRFDSLPLADANRYKFIPNGQRFEGNLSLRSIYYLSVHSKRSVNHEKITGGARFRSVGMMLYNSHVADAICSRENYLMYAATIAQSVAISILRRPRGVWSVEDLADHISNS